MADSKLTELLELIGIADDDLLYIVDDSEAPKTSKKIKVVNLLNKVYLALENVDNTSDLDKPVSTAVQALIDAINLNLTSLNNHAADTNNPHGVTKAQVGLGNVDNTADVDKPVSTATAAAISQAISDLIDGAPVTLDTLNELAAAIADDENFATTITTQLANHVSDQTNPHNVTKAQVGLGNADNTSDANKPVSTAQQAALDLKYDASNPNGYETPAELNARDTANRARANHTGTQLAATISDLKAYLDNYLDRSINENKNYTVNTGTAFSDRVNFNRTPAHTATYLVRADVKASQDDTGSNIEVELLINGAIQDRWEYEPQDSGGVDGASGTDQRWSGTLSTSFDATAAVDFNVQIRYRTEVGGIEATIKQHTLTIERYLP